MNHRYMLYSILKGLAEKTTLYPCLLDQIQADQASNPTQETVATYFQEELEEEMQAVIASVTPMINMDVVQATAIAILLRGAPNFTQGLLVVTSLYLTKKWEDKKTRDTLYYHTLGILAQKVGVEGEEEVEGVDTLILSLQKRPHKINPNPGNYNLN